MWGRKMLKKEILCSFCNYVSNSSFLSVVFIRDVVLLEVGPRKMVSLNVGLALVWHRHQGLQLGLQGFTLGSV